MANNEHLNDSMRMEREIPLSWKAAPETLSVSEISAINDTNVTLLNAIAVIEEQAHVDMYDHSQTSQEMLRIDAKLDLLTSLVTRLVFQNHLVPPPQRVSLSHESISWQGDIDPDIGESGVLELFIHPAIAVPLQLPVKLIANQKAEIIDLNKDVKNALEKFLFRQHRRAIALAKKAKK